MGGDVGKPCAHEIAHGGHFLIIKGGVVADDDDLRVGLIDVDARLSHLLQEKFVAEHEGALAGVLFLKHGGGGLAGGEHLFAAHVQAHARKALYVEIGVVGGIVGEKEEVAARFLHAADEVQRTGNEVFAEVEGAVHIEKEAAHVLYVHFPPSSKAILPRERLCTAASASTR